MNSSVIILLAEANKEHSDLIRTAFLQAGVSNQVIEFSDGQDLEDFLFADTVLRSLEPMPLIS